MESRQRKPLSRRDMLRLAASAAGVTAIGSILAACGSPSTSNQAAAPTAAPAAAAPTAAPGAAAPTAAPAAEPSPTPVTAQVFGSDKAKVKIRYWTILGSVDGIVMNDLVKKFSDENPDIAVESLQGLTDFVQKMQASGI